MIFWRKIGVLLILLALCDIANAQINKHLEVVLRNVGHKTLLQSGDSTSRVLPIQKNDESYLISFENEIELLPDDVALAIVESFEKGEITTSAMVQIKSCHNDLVLHSFEHGVEEEGLYPCKTRALPKGCYRIVVTFIEEPKVNLNYEEDSDEYWIWFLISGTITAIILAFVFLRRRSSSKSNIADYIKLGTLNYDKKGMKLIDQDQTIELSGKEVKLLDLFLENQDQTLERARILNEVWGDEGDYVGRTLDVFVSKLRKKLAGDSNIKITNIRGVGYKFYVES